MTTMRIGLCAVLTLALAEASCAQLPEDAFDVVIENGRVVMHDKAEVMKNNPDIRDAYLGGIRLWQAQDFRRVHWIAEKPE